MFNLFVYVVNFTFAFGLAVVLESIAEWILCLLFRPLRDERNRRAKAIAGFIVTALWVLSFGSGDQWDNRILLGLVVWLGLQMLLFWREAKAAPLTNEEA